MNISIEKAKSIREELGATHLIILAADSAGDCVATHGSTERHSLAAANTGNELKKLLGFPENMTNSQPALYLNKFIYSAEYTAFRQYLDRYDDHLKSMFDEGEDEHYQKWLDTREPGTQYPGRSENDQAEEFSPRVWEKNERAAQGGSDFTLGFSGSEQVFAFALGWGKRLAELEQEKRGGEGLDLSILYELEQLCAGWRERSERAFNEDFSESSETYDACANGLRRWLFKAEPMVRAALASALTPRELEAIERIEAILNNDHNPDAAHDWADCGEVDVPIVLDAVKRLNKLAVEYVAPVVEQGEAE
ncbi:hypothetical protein Q5H92_22775 [Hymenobacter sp. M29]|uniref:Uncharacterized protein n=1 Tax=Hymenobacter mellowenesis TaxID=3063995 RepID=A0ABT9AH52_9BACT|nr:hypothetical protein [Hymenobacter sp. M29]MDO7849206.1 hypothetical protein [Hymenobacter sp. M29]